MYTIIGCGNANRSDDAVGVYVAQALSGQLAHQAAHVRVFNAGTAGMEVMFQARGASALVIVDACHSGHPPGSIFRVPGAELEQTYTPGLNLHDFRWDHALMAGRKIFRDDFPQAVTVFLIEAGSLELGCELTEPVRRAAHRVMEDIFQDIERQIPLQHRSPTRQQSACSSTHQSFTHSIVNPEMTGNELAAQACADLQYLSIRNRHLQFPAAVHRYYLQSTRSVALLPQQQDLLLLPLVGSSAGGVLVKQRNAEGDCTVALDDILQRRELSKDLHEARAVMRVAAHWETERAALVLPQLFEPTVQADGR